MTIKLRDLREGWHDRNPIRQACDRHFARVLQARASAVVDTAGLTVDTATARLIDAVAPVLNKDARAFGLRSGVS
jgi:XRE family aerobic/anaerobic benzoate catabolism transcriptional regulator